MDVRTRIAWNLRRIRSAKGISQENLAVDADVDRTYVSGIERREYNPSIELLERIAKALEVDIVDLIVVPPRDEAPPEALRPGRKRGE